MLLLWIEVKDNIIKNKKAYSRWRNKMTDIMNQISMNYNNIVNVKNKMVINKKGKDRAITLLHCYVARIRSLKSNFYDIFLNERLWKWRNIIFLNVDFCHNINYLLDYDNTKKKLSFWNEQRLDFRNKELSECNKEGVKV